MASCPADKSYGHESCRFEKDVDKNFHCSICYNVLKEPRTCRNNDHVFCLACITEHLTINSQTCPECNDHLSVDTLRRSRLVNNHFCQLRIKCDHTDRGCPEFVRVADLKTHVENCGFAPVLCSNEKCGMEMNKQDKVHHESEACDYRRVKCCDFRQIQEVAGRLEGNLKEVNEKVEAIKEDQPQVQDEVNAVKEKVEAIKEDQQEIKKEAEGVKNEVQEVKQEVADVKDNVFKVNKDMDEVKITMSQMLEKLNMLELLNKLPSASEGMINTPTEDILIAGGFGHSMNVEQSMEIYSWEKYDWFEMSEMNEKHERASSFIYKDQLFVVGGYKNNTIETLDLNEIPLKWMKFPGELPFESDDHQTVVYQQRIIHIGGYNYHEGEWSNVIGELQLSSPYTVKELCQMPEPRDRHGAEIFEDKVLIMGGKNRDGTLDSVLKFDVTTNEYTEMPPLPRALKKMATVRWKDNVVVLGGINMRGKVLSHVLMYDSKTGKTTTLPSMLEERAGCCAVTTGNTIVVMGGYDDDREVFKSVECFTMGGSSWEYLPDMNKARCGAIAEVLPSRRKYV